MENNEKKYRLLVIFFGSTSSKMAIFENEEKVYSKNVSYKPEQIQACDTIYDQMDFRRQDVIDFISESGFQVQDFDAIVPKAGITPPIERGGYRVNDKMVDHLKYRPHHYHASNMCAIIADEIAKPYDIPCYTYDSPHFDMRVPEAKITGFPELEWNGVFHLENHLEVGARAAEMIGKKYEEANLIVCHLGGGISEALHRRGQIVDLISDDAYFMSPERSGGVPAIAYTKMCFSGKHTEKEMLKRIQGKGGLVAHLGTADAREIEKMIEDGNEHAKLIYYTFAYMLAKGIGQLATANAGDIDAIVFTGGLSRSQMLIAWITSLVSWIAPTIKFAGEFETEHAAFGVLRILRGEETAHEFNY